MIRYYIFIYISKLLCVNMNIYTYISTYDVFVMYANPSYISISISISFLYMYIYISINMICTYSRSSSLSRIFFFIRIYIYIYIERRGPGAGGRRGNCRSRQCGWKHSPHIRSAEWS